MNKLFKLFALVIVMLGTVVAVEAKSKVELVTSVFETTIDCESCSKKIMNLLPYQKGVKSVEVKLADKSVTVKYDPSKSSDEDIVATLKKLDVKATKRVEAECTDCDCSASNN